MQFETQCMIRSTTDTRLFYWANSQALGQLWRSKDEGRRFRNSNVAEATIRHDNLHDYEIVRS